MTIKKVFIIGNGDEAKIAAGLINDQKKLLFSGYFEVHKDKFDFYSPEGSLKENIKFKDYVNTDNFFCIGIGYNYDRNKVYKILKEFENIQWISLISDTAKIRSDVIIGDGCIIHDNVYINRGTVLGNHCIINNNSSIDHDCFMDDFSSTGPVVITGGRITVGKLSYIGMNSVILQNIKIGQNSVIGANSLVNKNCDNNSLYFGITNKFIKKIPNDFNYLK